MEEVVHEKIINVIKSCQTPDQLETCLNWLKRLNLEAYPVEDIDKPLTILKNAKNGIFDD